MMIDVVIIGAGPSGLMAAIELIRHGLTCRIFDKAPVPSQNSKAIGIQPRTLEVFDHIGLVEECLEQGLKINHFVPYSHGEQLADMSFDLIDSPFKFLLSLEQSLLELILIKRLQKLGCKIEREVELLSFEQHPDRVHLTLRHNQAGEIEEEAAWLLGCDGAHSTIRKGLNLTFEGVSLPENLSLADLEIEWKYSHDRARAFLNENGILAAFPMKGENKFRIIFQLQRAENLLKHTKHVVHGEVPHGLLEPPKKEEVLEFIHCYSDSKAKIIKSIWMANFFINSRMVNRYRDNRVFLIGDAAHIHSPVGAQGMNTGIQDAFNLVWKLALVQKEKANPALLDSYHDERHDVGKKLLHATEQATKLVLMRSPFLIFIRNFLMRLVGSFKVAKRKIISTIAQIDICYPKSQWISQNGKRTRNLAGKRVVYEKRKGSTKFHLLLINSKSSKYESNDLVEVCKLDPNEEIVKRYGDRTMYLVRPDGYVGFCGDLEDENLLDAYLANYEMSLLIEGISTSS